MADGIHTFHRRRTGVMRNIFRNLFPVSHVEGVCYFVEELSNGESSVKE